MTEENTNSTHESSPAARRETESNATAWQLLRQVGRGALRAGRYLTRKGGEGLAFIGGQADEDVREMLGEFPLFALSTAIPHRNEIPFVEETERPVVLIHGVGGSAGNFGLIRAMLFVSGRSHVHCFDYRKHRSMSTVIPAFAAFVNTVRAAHPNSDGVEIVAHSMGGLIARHAAQRDEVLNAIQHLITLGTPHHGTHLARWGGARYIRELRPDSPFIRDLYEEEPRRREQTLLRITSFWTPRDVMVLPSESAILEGARNIEMREATHMSWLSRPRLARRVLAELHGHVAALPAPHQVASGS